MAEQPERPSRRPKRVSLKGRGADIFFGDYTPPGPPAELSGEREVRAPESDQSSDTPDERLPAGRQTDDDEESKQASKLSSKQASKPKEGDKAPEGDAVARSLTGAQVSAHDEPESLAPRRAVSRRSPQADQAHPETTPDMSAEISSLLEMQATIASTFRYTEEELTALSDALYHISREQKVRITKQEAARLGLYLVLEDYRRRGPESLLGQLAASRRHRRTGGR